MFGGLDLAAVVRRDRRNLIGKDDSALHRIERAEVFQGVWRPVAAVEAEESKSIRSGHTLIVQVVNCEDRARRAEGIAATKPRVKIDGQQRRVPIVRVYDLWREPQKLTTADHGATEECISLEIIVVSVKAAG